MIHRIQIEKRVLDCITPTEEDRKHLQEIITELTEKLLQKIRQRNLQVSVELVGSTAKDTYLRVNLDIDLFLVFPKEIQKEILARETKSIGRALLTDTEECYAEHPYIRGYYRSHLIEIVPCYQVQDATEKQSAVDRTPLHTAYVKAHLTEPLKQDIRLFKQFLHGIGCYGAEAAVQGFSGYLCELLILKFQSFSTLITSARTWKPGETIALDMKDPLKFPEPLTVIDPVDHERNVASAVSTETFHQFTKACRAYEHSPSLTFFFPRKVSPWSLDKIKQTLSSRPYRYLGVIFPKPSLLPEILIPQIQKTCRSIRRESELYGFQINDITFTIDEDNNTINIILSTDPSLLSPTYLHMGPPIDKKEHVSEFQKKWHHHPEVVSGPFEQEGRLYVELKRSYRDIKEFLQMNLPSFRLGKNIDTIMTDSFNLVDEEDLLIDPLARFWTTHLDNKEPWER